MANLKTWRLFCGSVGLFSLITLTTWSLVKAVAEPPDYLYQVNLSSSLAPDLPELHAALANLTLLLQTSESIFQAMALLQNTWMEELFSKSGEVKTPLPTLSLPTNHPDNPETPPSAPREPPNICNKSRLLSIGLRSELFLKAYRDAVQSARIASVRLQELLTSPLVKPLIDQPLLKERKLLDERLTAAEHYYLEALNLHLRYLAPLLQSCNRLPVLKELPGMGRNFLVAEANTHEFIAVALLGEGYLCPPGLPITFTSESRRTAVRIAAVPKEVCYGATRECTCIPKRVFPGEVLAPLATQ